MREGFPHLLRQHRTQRRWSQEQLGLEAEVSPRHLSYLETGQRDLDLDLYARLVAAFDELRRERDEAWAEAQVELGFGRRVPEMGVTA